MTMGDSESSCRPEVYYHYMYTPSSEQQEPKCAYLPKHLQISCIFHYHRHVQLHPSILPPSMPNATISEQKKTHEKFAYRKIECLIKQETLRGKRLDKFQMHPCVTVQASGASERCIMCCFHCTFGDGKLRERLTVHTAKVPSSGLNVGLVRLLFARNLIFVDRSRKPASNCFIVYRKRN